MKLKIINNFSIGVDIEDISKFKELKEIKDKNFLIRVFTPKELSYCFSKKNSAPHLAARFCAKEAIIKALADFNLGYIGLDEIEIINNTNKSPSVKIKDHKFDHIKLKLSVSHSTHTAVAFVIATT